MKKNKMLILLPFVSTIFIIAFYGSTKTIGSHVSGGEGKSKAIKKSDFIRAQGKQLVKADGSSVILRGVNAGGYLLQEFWMTPVENSKHVAAEIDIYSHLTERFGEKKMLQLIELYQDSYWTEQDFDNCAKMGMNVVRLPFWYRNIADAEGKLKKNAFDRMDWFVKEAGRRGLYVILDFHGAPGSQNGSDHSGVDGKKDKLNASKFFFGNEAKDNQKLFYELWEEVAAHYNGNPVVAGYDLLNEPYCTYRYTSQYSDDQLHQMLWAVYDECYSRIRKIDSDHVIIMEATWDPVDLPDPADYRWENVMYEYHNYLYADYNNASGKQIANMKTKLDAIDMADYNVPSYLGEFNYFANFKAWDEGLELLNENGISWTVWTYKTIRKVGNWGIYYNDIGLRSINLETATYEQIRESFKGMQSADCNSELKKVIEKHLAENAAAE